MINSFLPENPLRSPHETFPLGIDRTIARAIFVLQSKSRDSTQDKTIFSGRCDSVVTKENSYL